MQRNLFLFAILSVIMALALVACSGSGKSVASKESKAAESEQLKSEIEANYISPKDAGYDLEIFVPTSGGAIWMKNQKSNGANDPLVIYYGLDGFSMRNDLFKATGEANIYVALIDDNNQFLGSIITSQADNLMSLSNNPLVISDFGGYVDMIKKNTGKTPTQFKLLLISASINNNGKHSYVCMKPDDIQKLYQIDTSNSVTRDTEKVFSFLVSELGVPTCDSRIINVAG